MKKIFLIIIVMILSLGCASVDKCISGDCNNGQGTFKWVNGDVYTGEFKDNKPNGQGTVKYGNSDKYIGEFKNGEKNGQGILEMSTGSKKVQTWIKGELEGECISGNCENGDGTYILESGSKYVGQFKDGDYDGVGTFTYSSGSTYVGQFKDGEYDGQGTLTYTDGSKYVGQWKEDKYNGHGTLTNPDGSKFIGEFENGNINLDRLENISISQFITFLNGVTDEDIKTKATESLNDLLEIKLEKFIDSNFNPYNKYKELMIKSEDGTELGKLIDLLRLPILSINPNTGEKLITIGFRKNKNYLDGFDLIMNIRGKDAVITFKPYKDWLVAMSLEYNDQINEPNWTYALAIIIQSMKTYPVGNSIDVDLLEKI